jgi:hypothetical protein
MSKLKDLWQKIYDEYLVYKEDCTELEASQAADDYVEQYMSEKADFEYQRNKEDV